MNNHVTSFPATSRCPQRRHLDESKFVTERNGLLALVRQCKDAQILGKARFVKSIRGLSEVKNGLVATPEPLKDGDLVVVQDGEEVMAGRLYHIAVIVIDENGSSPDSK